MGAPEGGMGAAAPRALALASSCPIYKFWRW